MDSIAEQLRAPFPASDIEWRAGSTNKEKTRALALAYIDARAVQDRLDNVLGIEGWWQTYRPGPQGGVVCALTCVINGTPVTKEDGADNTEFEAIKGGLSDSFKRAAVQFGIGRYLYHLDGQWVPCEQRGKTVVLSQIPKLPAWALPPDDKSQAKTAPAPTSENGNGSLDMLALSKAIKAAGIESPKALIANVTDHNVDDLENTGVARKAVLAWATKHNIEDPYEEILQRAREHVAYYAEKSNPFPTSSEDGDHVQHELEKDHE